MNNKLSLNIIWFVILLLLSLWVDKPDISCLHYKEVYNFWGGLWHGTIMIPAFIASLFVDDITLYAINNNGGWYNFGFVLGVHHFALGFLRGLFNSMEKNT